MIRTWALKLLKKSFILSPAARGGRPLLKWSYFIQRKLKREAQKKLDVNSELYWNMKEQLQFNERILLQSIGFDVIIKHPSASTLLFVKRLHDRKLLPQGSQKQLARWAYDWCLASYGAEFCIIYEPEMLACAFLYGASKDLKIEIRAPAEGRWWQICLTASIVADEKDLCGEPSYFREYLVPLTVPLSIYLAKVGNKLADGSICFTHLFFPRSLR